MSMSPSVDFMPSSACSRSASHAPPVYSPTMALFGTMRGFNSAASFSQSSSASGSFIEVLLQYELRRHGVHRLSLQAAQLALGFDRGEALVHARHRQLEAPLEPPREVFRLPRHLVRLAARRRRHADHQTGRAPFVDEFLNLVKVADRRKRVRGVQLGLADRDANTLETEVEGEDGPPLRHAPPRPATA